MIFRRKSQQVIDPSVCDVCKKNIEQQNATAVAPYQYAKLIDHMPYLADKFLMDLTLTPVTGSPLENPLAFTARGRATRAIYLPSVVYVDVYDKRGSRHARIPVEQPARMILRGETWTADIYIWK